MSVYPNSYLCSDTDGQNLCQSSFRKLNPWIFISRKIKLNNANGRERCNEENSVKLHDQRRTRRRKCVKSSIAQEGALMDDT
jgi:hypothetical protein